MKKIKGLLLFGILTLLGIGSSFAGIQGTFYVDYFDNSGNYLTYGMGYGIPTPALRRDGPLDFSLSSYGLNSSVSFFSDNSNVVYYNPNGNRLLYVYYPGDHTTFIFPITSTWEGLGWGDNLFNTEYGIYSRVFCNNTLQSDILTNSSNFCDTSILFINNHNTYTISSLGDIYDTRIDGFDYYKGPVASSVGLGYSFGFVDGSGWQNDGNHYYLNDSDKFYFRSILFSGSSVVTVDGPLVFRISGNVSGNYQIFALGPTGDYQNFSFNYSIYNCPVSSVTFFDCSLNQGGIVSGNFSYDFTSDNPYTNLIYFLTKDLSTKFWSSYSSSNHTLDLTRVSSTSFLQDTTTITLNVIPTDGIDVIGGIPVNGGNQSFPDPIFDGGVFDANTYFIEEAIKCYITSGTVCGQGFTYESSENYVNNYEHGERNRNEFYGTGDLTFYNSVDMLSQYCLNTNTIQYSFCSQLYLYEGYPITYYYNNGYFNYIISGSGWEVNLGTLWSGQLGYAYCEGPYCSNFNEGLPQFIRKDTGDYSDFGFSGEYVSLDFFKNYFESGFFFQCPFSYSGSYFTIGGKLIDRLDKHDPLKPINCMIAGFSHGIKSNFFGDSKLGLSHSGVLLNNTGSFAIRFYTFLDILLCLGYIFFFSKLFKFLKKH